MIKPLRPLAIGLTFIVGCAVGGAASRVVIPPASAQQANVQRWEYLTMLWEGPQEHMTANINRAGAEGWEAFSTNSGSGSWYFKRPKP